MTIEELGRQVKTKHPEYSSYPDSVVGNRVIVKYPEYRSKIGKENTGDGIIGSVKEALGARTELKPYGEAGIPNAPQDPISGALEAATQTLGSPIRAGKTIERLAPTLGEVIAEEGGKAGYPRTAATVGTAISMAPELLVAGGGLKSLYESSNPIARAITTTPKELGPEFQAGEKAAGISGDLPVQRGAIARFPNMAGNPSIQPPPQAPFVAPKSYPKDINSFINFARARVQAFGDKLTPQELDDYKTMLSTNIKAMKVKGLAKTEPYAIASQLQKDVTALHNSVIPGREQLNKVYALSKTIHPELGDWITDGVKKYGIKAIGAVLAGLGIGAGTQILK